MRGSGFSVLVGMALALGLSSACTEQADCPAGQIEGGSRCETLEQDAAPVSGHDAQVEGQDGRHPDARPSYVPRDASLVQEDGGAEREPECLVDEDDDGYGTRSRVGTCAAYVESGDCNDQDDAVHPDAPERCDGQDDDCDGAIDEGALNACGQCGLLPIEVCNGVDDDCDGQVDQGVVNACGRCGDVPAEICNGSDDDCDGVVDDGVLNACGGCATLPFQLGAECGNGELGACARRGHYVCSGANKVVCDAPDGVPSTELCGDQIDNNCNGQADEDAAENAATWYKDCDGDGFAGADGVKRCTEPVATAQCRNYIANRPVSSNTDCDDTSSSYKPDAAFGLPASPNTSSDLNCDGNAAEKLSYIVVDDPAAWLPIYPACTSFDMCNCAFWDVAGRPRCSMHEDDTFGATLRREVNGQCLSSAVQALQLCR